MTDEAESSDKENTTSVMMVRPRRTRYQQRRRGGFHQQMALSSSQPQLSHPASASFHPSLSQEILDAFCMPVNALDAVADAEPRQPARNPQKPLRNRNLNKTVPLPADGKDPSSH